MAERTLLGLRAGVMAAWVAALLCGLLLPVYSDEIGWRFQERAGFDGLDKLYSDMCGPNTLAVPPWFMMPVRHFSALTNAAFADPIYVRFSGVLYALAFAAMLVLLVRRIAETPRQRAVLGMLGAGLMMLGIMPLIAVLSRPEQPILLAAMAALLLAFARQTDSTRAAWLRAGAIAVLGVIALSYHLKALFLLPLLLACLFYTSRSRWPRLIAGGLLVAAALVAAQYWVNRLQCPGDPVLKAFYGAHSIGMALSQLNDWRQVPALAGQLLGNVNVLAYARLAAPVPEPMASWLPAGQVSLAASHLWLRVIVIAWLAALLLGVAALVLALGQGLRTRGLDRRAVLALAALAGAGGWAATQTQRNVYEAGFVLPLAMLGVVLALACPRGGRLGGKIVEVPAILAALLGLASVPLVGAQYGPALLRAAGQPGYLAAQPYSVSAYGYAELKPQILATARLCAIPEPARARGVLVDELTYFAYMDSRLPQHRLGVLGLWRGTIRDPVAYLKGRRSDGILIGCAMLPGDLRARAKTIPGGNGAVCCLAPPGW